jgi:hypothetical protein
MIGGTARKVSCHNGHSKHTLIRRDKSARCTTLDLVSSKILRGSALVQTHGMHWWHLACCLSSFARDKPSGNTAPKFWKNRLIFMRFCRKHVHTINMTSSTMQQRRRSSAVAILAVACCLAPASAFLPSFTSLQPTASRWTRQATVPCTFIQRCAA